MQLRQLVGRDPKPRVIDLSHEVPTERADLRIQTEHIGWVSSLGRAVIFLDEAREYADTMRIDVDKLAEALHNDGVPASRLETLAVVVHPSENNRGRRIAGVKVGGWHRFDEGVQLESPADKESVLFDNALHIVAGGSNPDFTLWHEAGHLFASVTDQKGEHLYTTQNARRLRACGFAVLALSAGLETANGFAISDGLSPILGTAVAAAGGLAAIAGGIITAFPKHLLWILSSDERNADDFARQHADIEVVTRQEGPVPDNYIFATSRELSYWERITLLPVPQGAPRPSVAY